MYVFVESVTIWNTVVDDPAPIKAEYVGPLEIMFFWNPVATEGVFERT